MERSAVLPEFIAENTTRAVDGRDGGAKSLRKMAMVLDSFSRSKTTMTVAELAEATDLPKTTIHRIVASLREVGLLDQDGRRQGYRLGLKMFQYGSSVLASLDTPTRAHPHMAQLQQLTGEIIHFHMFDGSQMVCIEREETGSSSLTTLQSAPTYCTSVGKAYLAYQDEELVRKLAAEGLKARTPHTITTLPSLLEDLERTRARGYAIDNEEIELGVRCVGAPVRNSAGRVFAAVSVSGPVERMPDSRVSGLAPVVIRTANDISAALAE
ncbi:MULTISPECIES: IclR family transcriptional regulator [unclassified Rhizobium]|uniref:IclR family transcriptional regulator n=1 Tax=unclassified Rhizobium TaxID=2613769 RepID=UPI001ADAE317|nr:MULTISPECIES: IclR family transcriptional regulator [unclassified Rhizobium]MBO9127718.1 IclR family transcriptional regulator [Rhizobium sp. 16-488-2b]MBO9178180.1 IclR family transcriptional regulator [Rhizobium sp. 16-488-2a]